MKKVIASILILFLISGMAACSQTGTAKPGPAANGENTAGNDRTGTVPEQDPASGQEPAPGDDLAPGQEPAAMTLKVKVMDIKDDSFLAANIAEGANAAELYRIDAQKTVLLDKNGISTDTGALKTGMLVDINYDGAVMESFPAQLGGIKSIQIREEGEDLAGLYMKVIKDLYEVDPGLNGDIERIAFDFNKVTNLAETEKTALVYMAGNEFGLETLQGTFEELREQGYIAKDQLYFKTGLLYSIEVKSEEKDSFMFDARKWRSGDGAYYFLDCTAKKEKSGWAYTVGGEAIS